MIGSQPLEYSVQVYVYLGQLLAGHPDRERKRMDGSACSKRISKNMAGSLPLSFKSKSLHSAGTDMFGRNFEVNKEA